MLRLNFCVVKNKCVILQATEIKRENKKKKKTNEANSTYYISIGKFVHYKQKAQTAKNSDKRIVRVHNKHI